MNTAKIYHDRDGNECTIHEMVKREPYWAAERVQSGEQAAARCNELADALGAIWDHRNQQWLVPFYDGAGGHEMLPVAECVNRRKEAAKRLRDAQCATGRWIVTVAGPDDVYEHASELEALRNANQINRAGRDWHLRNPSGPPVLLVATADPAGPLAELPPNAEAQGQAWSEAE